MATRTSTSSWWTINGTRDRMVEHAGRRCECTGQCDRAHRKHQDGRCHVIDGRRHRLVIGPAAPGLPWTLAARLPVDALRVWCLICLADAERAARRHAAAEHDTDQQSLFGDGRWSA